MKLMRLLLAIVSPKKGGRMAQLWRRRGKRTVIPVRVVLNVPRRASHGVGG